MRRPISRSLAGRWGERLSKGVTRSLAADLGDRLHATIVTDGPTKVPSMHVKVTINASDVTSATSVVAAMTDSVAQLSDAIAATARAADH